jgi:hypothetical protein
VADLRTCEMILMDASPLIYLAKSGHLDRLKHFARDRKPVLLVYEDSEVPIVIGAAIELKMVFTGRIPGRGSGHVRRATQFALHHGPRATLCYFDDTVCSDRGVTCPHA